MTYVPDEHGPSDLSGTASSTAASSVNPMQTPPPTDAAASTTGASVLRGGVWNVVSLLLPQVFTLAVSIVAARSLGTDGMGQQSFIAFVSISTGSIVAGGLPLSLMRFIGETMGRDRPDCVRALVAWAWRLNALGAVIGFAVVAGVGLARADLQSAWVLAAVTCGVGVLHNVPSSVLVGMQRWREASMVGLVTGAVATVVTVAVLVAGGGIVGMFAVEVVVATLNLLWTSRLARAAVPGGSAATDIRSLRHAVLRFAGYGLLTNVLGLVVWRRSEFFFLDRYSTDTDIALYSVAFAAVAAMIRLPEALAAVTSPAFATLHGAGEPERIRVGFGRALRLMALLGVPLAAFAAVLGPALLRIVYGTDYSEAGTVLLILMLFFPFIPLLTVTASLFTGIGKMWVPLLFNVVAAATNIALDIVLIPRHAAIGAAVANGVAQSMIAIPAVVYATRLVGGVAWEPGAFARTVLAVGAGAAVAAGALDAFGDHLGLLVGMVAGGATMLGLVLLLRPLPPDDAAWLEEALGQRLGRRIGALCRRLSRAG